MMTLRTVAHDIRSYESLDPLSLMIKLYEESRRNADDIQRPPRAIAEHMRYASLASEHITLPQPMQHGRPLFEAMVERTSIRFYTDEAVGLSQVATLLRAASAGDLQEWAQDVEAGVTLHFLLVAWRVEGLVPAVYLYEHDKHALARIGPAPDQKAGGANLVLQTEFANAPLIILITGNLAAACARHGAWGHRQLLLRAGAAGQRLWLSSLGVGLVGTIFAGFLPRAAQHNAGVDGYKNASLVAYSAGHILPSYRLGK